MDDLTTALDHARHTIDPGWDATRAHKARDAFHGRLRRSRRTRAAILIAAPALALVIALGVRAFPRHAPHAEGVASQSTQTSPRPRADITGPFRFWDGSTATPLDDRAKLRAEEISPSRIVVDVDRGRGRFVVTPGRRDREFVVRAQGVTVRVLGTAFTVGAEARRARVTVEHGRVSVEWEGGRALLVDGESGLYPPVEAEGTSVPSVLDEETEPDPAQSTDAAPRQERNWRRLAESGDFGEAFAALEGAVVRDRPEELLLAADAARLSSHPREALTYYQRVVRDHASDPRAPLAAFTMGRVLLTQLGRPREAASAFARARALAGSGSLAEDALAREVEARSNAGETERARSLAEEYVARYPAGQRIRAVRRFGGLP